MLISNLSGKFGWIAYHEQIFTKERLQSSLLPALSVSSDHIAVVDQPDQNEACIVEINGKIYRKWVFPFTYKLIRENSSTLQDVDILIIPERCVYFMDAASIIVGYLLRIDRFATVLDLCSAPGGKALIIIKRMLEDISKYGGQDKMCHVTCNEYDKNRFNRLNKVLQDHIGSSDLNMVNAVTISSDATQPSFSYSLRTKNRFSKILIDAPCSSDRHLILSNNLSRWSIKLAKRNSKRQTEIIKNAIKLLECEGTALYCTCTLNEIENDFTMEQMCDALGISANSCFLSMLRAVNEFNSIQSHVKIILKPIRSDIIKGDLDEAFDEDLMLNNIKESDKHIIIFEYTKFGSYILPDTNNGIGPLYLAFIEKKNS